MSASSGVVYDFTGTDLLIGKPSASCGPWRLKVISGESTGKELLLTCGTYVAGKGRECDLVLCDNAVSRMHLEIAVLQEGVRLRDLDSTNGSFCNGIRFHEIEALPGALIAIGQTELELQSAQGLPNLPLSTKKSLGRLVGKSMAMRQMFAILERVAVTDAAVILQGETGTGKDLCAQAIHQHSLRASQPLVVVDLAGIQPNLIESELFGHVRGAFTGAVNDRAGAFECADKGSIFLDEVGDLPLDLQPRLLRAIENRQSKRLGANNYRSFDVRVIAATHRNLAEEIRKGLFREDLYHRLAVVKIVLPSLRERREDIPLLVKTMLDSMNQQICFGPRTQALLENYHWPGNVRELRNVVERAVSLGDERGEVPEELLSLQPARQQPLATVDVPFKEAKERLVDSFERDYIVHLMERCKHNVSRAARQAGIDRVYLHRLLKKHGLGG